MSQQISTSFLYEQNFLQFISNSQFSNDFERLKAFLNSGSDQFSKIISNFLEPEKRRKSLPRKSIPKSPMRNKSQTQRIRRSADLRISLDFSDEDSIPEFYNSKPIKTHKLRSLKPPDYILTLSKLQKLLKTRLSLPSFFALPIMVSLDPSVRKTRKFEIKYSKFVEFAEAKLEGKSITESIFSCIDQTNRGYLLQGDFAPFIVSLIQSHHSLKFLQHEIHLQSAYCKCIISRIFFTLDTDLRGIITYQKFANSNFCDCLIAVDNAVDVSDVSDYFSYEHFYVLYSLFSAIDINDTGRITVEQLSEYDDFRIPLNLVKRLVSFIPNHKEELISFSDFVYFLCAVEDKSSETSLHIWFKVCDEDEGGVLSIYQIKHLYSLQKEKMANAGIDPIKFKHIKTKIIDLIGCGNVTISSLKKSGAWDSFFNIIVDYRKYAELESRDPMFRMKVIQNISQTPLKQWDLFCQEEYKRISNEC